MMLRYQTTEMRPGQQSFSAESGRDNCKIQI